MGLSTLDSGKMTSKKGTASKNGKTAPIIKVITKLAKNKAKGHSSGGMTVPTLVNSNKITSMEKEYIYGKMEGCSMGNGITTKCTGRAYSLGQMVGNTKAPTKMIRSMGLGSLLLEMAAFMKENGKMGSSTGVEFTGRKRFQGKGYGRMESELDGWIIKRTRSQAMARKILIFDFDCIFTVSIINNGK